MTQTKSDDRKSGIPRRLKVLLINAVIILIAALLFALIAPAWFSQTVFQGILLNWPYLAWPILIGTIFYIPIAEVIGGKTQRRSILYCVVSGLLVIGGWVLTSKAVDYLTYKTYAHFEARDGLVRNDPDATRFTPLRVAHTDINNSVKVATEDAERDDTVPVITERGFGYVTPITPDGFVPAWFGDNSGFLYFDDSNEPHAEKVQRIDKLQEVGSGMYWFDNLWLRVFRQDRLATYESPHVVLLDQENPDSWALVVSKIKYRFWLIPYWGGTTIIHANGTIEELNSEQAKEDDRLNGQWIVPLDLLNTYIEAQNLRVGFFASFFRVTGKLEIEKLDGDNQFPFITKGSDGRIYAVSATKAEGSGAGLYRMFYADATTFELSYVEFDPSTTVYGPNAAEKRVKNLTGYIWFNPDTNTGRVVVTEPVYIVRENDPTLYWKFTITNTNYAGIAATVVVNAHDLDQMAEFKDRGSYEQWLRGETSFITSNDATSSSRAALIKALEKRLNEAARLLGELRELQD